MLFTLFAILLSAPAGVEITYLANEAYLVDDGERAVLFDAFVPEAYSGYEPLADETWQAMRNGAAPFDRVVAAVVSHHHRDHFQADAAAAFMNANPGVVLFGPPNIVEPLRQAGYAGERIVSVLPDYGEQNVHDIAGLRLQLFRLRHRQSDTADEQNLGAVLEIGGLRILHTGDVYPERGNFRPYHLAQDGIDIAFIPDWFYAAEWFPDGAAQVREAIAPACTFATHVALDGRAEHRERLGKEFPELHFSFARGEKLDIAGCRKRQ